MESDENGVSDGFSYEDRVTQENARKEEKR